ncbi:hypothetical protein M4I32_12920 [Microbacterium sp. LRZ72]|uniref:hypothetical protein n=1 Tax=Microbacterium sp. LRZ72 TaxID=2942481 RepID=UPI00299FD568|nr:hypothetical protein [Microbacterium sp. LRZ72]MDX2377704.1 hypothetical protein [Microbacterium sp. LRZ72]
MDLHRRGRLGSRKRAIPVVRELRLRLLMHLPRMLSLGVVLGVTLGVGVLAPATAAPEPRGDIAIASVVPAAVVEDEPWSSPAYPVDCDGANGQIACTPTNPADVTAQQCFIQVVINGTRATVCTAYEGHAAAIQGAGGKPVVVAYGCSFGDVLCASFENFGRGMAIATTGMMYAVALNMQFDTSSLLWTAAVGEWSFWQWAILIIVFGAMVWAVTAAVVSGDREQLVSAIVRSFIAIPAVPLTLWLTGHLLNTVDEMTWYVMNREGPIALFSTLQSVMWAGGQANYFFAVIIHGLLMVGMLLLMLVFAFRNVVLAALIAVGPVAWMIFPVRGIGPQWVIRYVSAVVVLLLTGPLTVGFVTLIINGLADVRTIWDPQSWPLLIGLVLVAFAPFAIFGLFSFVGGVAADSLGSALGSGARRVGGNAARSVASVPTRLGGSPAGIPSGSRGGASPRPPSRAGAGGSARPGGADGPAGTSPTNPARQSVPASAGAASTPAPTTAGTQAATSGPRAASVAPTPLSERRP